MNFFFFRFIIPDLFFNFKKTKKKMSLPDDSFITNFQALTMTELSKNIKHMSQDNFIALRNSYKESKIQDEKRLEQISVHLMLLLLTSKRPEHLSDLEYLKIIHEVQQNIECLSMIMQRFFTAA